MKFAQFNRLLVGTLAVVLVVACGDGKNKKRQPIKKSPNSTTAAGTQKPGTQKPVTDPTKQDPKAAAKNAEQEKLVEGYIAAAITGEQILKTELADGNYTLTNVITTFKNAPTVGTSTWLYAYRKQAFTLETKANESFAQLGESKEEQTIFSGSDPKMSDKGREFAVPSSIQIEKAKNIENYVLISLTSLTKTTLDTKSGAQSVVIANTVNGLQESNGSTAASVPALLASNPVNGAYQAKDGSRLVDLKIKKVSATSVRLHFEIVEIKDQSIRNVVLEYTLKPLATAQAEGGKSEPAPAVDNSQSEWN